MKKVCTKCGIEKDINEFHKRKNSKCGVRSHCKLCTNKKNLENYHKDGYDKKSHHMRARKHSLMKRYEMTHEEYEKLLEKQDGRCMICGTTSPWGHFTKPKATIRKFFCIDHNHKTGEIRGLLCHPCNMGLGNFQENLEILKEACRYMS